MKIYRDGKAIELTEDEICNIYFEARNRNYVDDVVLKLSENYNVDLNKVKLDVQQIAEDVMAIIAEDDTHWDCEQDAFKRAIETYLKENGIEWRNE